MKSVVMAVDPAQIALLKAIVESYDNLVTLRTEDPARHHLRMWFAEESEADVNELIASLLKRFSIRILS